MLAMVQTSDAVGVRLAVRKLINKLLELRFDFDYVVVDPVAVVFGHTILDNARDVALLIRRLDPFSIGKGPIDGELDGVRGCGSYVPEAHGDF